MPHMKNDKELLGPRNKSFKHDVVVEQIMKEVYQNLSEKGKRLYAGVEAFKLPHGGIDYISNILNCNRRTIRSG